MKKLLVLLSLATSISAYAAAEVEMVGNSIYNLSTVKAGEDTFSITQIKGAIYVIKSNASQLKANSASTLTCVSYTKNVNKNSNLESDCLVKDSDGDTFISIFSRTGSMGNTGAGKQELKGLTGKYVGMNGTCTYEAKYGKGDDFNTVTTISHCNID
jgi:hypothetical protein